MFFTVEPNEMIVFESVGKIREVYSESGLYFSFVVWRRTLNRESTCDETLQIKDASFPDLKGVPINVSAVINYRIFDPLQATYAI